MPYWEAEPEPALRPFIERVCFSTDDGRAPQPVRVVPDGRLDLLVSVGTNKRSIHVFGAKTRALWVAESGALDNLALRLRPGTAAALLGVGADELTNAALDVRELLGADVDACLDAPDLGSRSLALQRLLRARADAAERRLDASVIAAARRLVQRDGNVRVAQLARDLGKSERQLERAFRRHVGLSPKTFARVTRFWRAWTDLQAGGAAVEVATARGYFDQPHLVRDFRAFAGEPPSRIFPSRRGAARPSLGA